MRRYIHNYDLFEKKVAKYPDRIENMYFTYLFLFRALNKIKPRLYDHKFDTGDEFDDKETKLLVKSLLDHPMVCFPKFDESNMFSSPLTKAELKKELREHFQNISTIFNCISCETCKLYGKLQILGIGTALKILFEENGDQIQRNELIAIVNTLRQISNSIVFATEMASTKQLQYQNFETGGGLGGGALSFTVLNFWWKFFISVFVVVVGLVLWKLWQ